MLIAVGRPLHRLFREARSREQRDAASRLHFFNTSCISRPLVASMPLAQITTGRLTGQLRRERAHRLRRTDQQQGVASGEIAQVGCSSDTRFERNARQVNGVGAIARDRRRNRRIARPQGHLAAGATRQAGERGAPRAAADHAYMTGGAHRLRLKAMEMRSAVPV
jgi:hypothetical protein